MALIIDIETTSWFLSEEHKKLVLRERQHKGLKDPDKIAENHKKIISDAALSPYTGQVTVVGTRITEQNESVMYSNQYKDPVDIDVLTFENEKDLLTRIWELIGNSISDGIRLVGFKSKKFDLPYLFVRSLINEVKPFGSYMDLIHPYAHNLHLDLEAMFDKGSLREIAVTLDCATDNITDGSELPELWNTDPAKVIEKCKSDLIQTAKIYERVQGWIPQKLQMFSYSKTDSTI